MVSIRRVELVKNVARPGLERTALRVTCRVGAQLCNPRLERGEALSELGYVCIIVAHGMALEKCAAHAHPRKGGPGMSRAPQLAERRNPQKHANARRFAKCQSAGFSKHKQ